MPLASLVSATKPPRTTGAAILSPEGRKRFFVVHGGLFSRDGVTLDEIRKIDRSVSPAHIPACILTRRRHGKQPGNEGLMCELLWTDPQEANGRGPSKRGVGIAFGPDVTRRWCTLNGVTGVIRSHEVRQDGYAIEHDGLCTTVCRACTSCCPTLTRYFHRSSRPRITWTRSGTRVHSCVASVSYTTARVLMLCVVRFGSTVLASENTFNSKRSHILL